MSAYKRSSYLIVLFLLACASGYSQSCNPYQNIDSTYQIVPMPLGTDTGGAPDYRCNNCSSAAIALPFNFCFYGKNYDTVYINNKGSITFDNPVFNFSSTGLPAGVDTLALDAFYADVDDSATPGYIYYKITPTHLIVQWNTVGYNTFDCDLYDNFQIIITNGSDSILPAGNNVSYSYYLMRWASGDSSGGTGGFAGVYPSVGVNKGDGVNFAQFGLFDTRGYLYYGPFDSLDDLYWMDGKSFVFNTCVTGNDIPPVILNYDSCQTFTMCATDTLTFGAWFICPQQGQKATVSETSPGLSGISTDTSSGNYIYGISTRIIAKLKDTGTHLITITSTDNSSPPLTTTLTYTIIINSCGDTTSGINELSVASGKWSVYPNPNNGEFLLQSSVVSGKWSVMVYNVLGELVYSHYQSIQASTYQIDLTTQPSGVYFYRILDDAGNLSGNGKFVIQ